jgi:serine/threonine protein kinase
MLTAGAHASRRAIARLRDESTMIARLGHPQVVTIYDVGEHQGIPYLCLELVEGGSLADQLGGNPIAPVEAARLTAALARVVQAAHDRGIIHRDLKPANVLLAGPPGSAIDPGRLKLTDFGLAKRLDAERSAGSSVTGMVLGTPSYMAPEQAMNRKARVGPTVDIYGLGAILYELLTDRPPFRGESPLETVFQVVRQPPVPPSRINDRVPEVLQAICLKCLEKEPSKRYPTATALADELERFASGRAMMRLRWLPNSWMRLGRATKVGAMVVLMLLGGLGLLLRKHANHGASPAALPHPVLLLTPPASGPLRQGGRLIDKGKVEFLPPLDISEARKKEFHFDLNDSELQNYLDDHMTRNARLWEEKRHGIRYWGPVDDREPFDVVYKFSCEFPVCSASLYASLGVIEAGASGILEVSTDPRRGWKEVAHGTTEFPFGAPIDISEQVREARTIYVRARMKGRDDGADSATAQFLRTSTLPDGHVNTKSPYVFELRAYNREVPILTGRVELNDGWSMPLWFDSDGVFSLDRVFDKPGDYRGTITVQAPPLEPVSKPLHIFCVPVLAPPVASRTVR